MTHHWLLQREPTQSTPNGRATMGALYLDGVWTMWTLEDEIRDVKIPKVTAIPPGDYPVVLTVSARFKRPLPEIQGVPGYTGIRMHAGNFITDTEGCPIVGFDRASGRIIYGTTKPAEKLLVALLKSYELEGSGCMLHVRNPVIFE